jgi:hypothetical protein
MMANKTGFAWRATLLGRLFFLVLALGAFALAVGGLDDWRIALVSLVLGAGAGTTTVYIAHRRAPTARKEGNALSKLAFPVVAIAVVISAQLGSATAYVMLAAGCFMLCGAIGLPGTSFRSWPETRTRGQD